LRVYGFKDVENIGIDIPAKGTILEVDNITGNEDYERPPPRFNEAALVKKLDPDNLNIGRPSTYAAIINKIQERGYVLLQDLEGEEKDAVTLCWDGKKIKETSEKINIGKEQNKLVPTSVGILVNDFLVKNFPEIMDYKFTASMEDELDDIAEGKAKWVKVMDKFYKKFHPVVEKLLSAKKTEIDKLSRNLGKHPTKDLDIIATLARFGPVVKMCETKSKCVYAPIKPPLTIDTITLNDAIKLFEYPKKVGMYEDKPIELFKGKHGYYLKWMTTKLSIETIDKIKDKEKITEKEAIELLKEKRKNIFWEGKDGTKQYTILEGPYGKYISIKDSLKPMKKSQNVKLVEDVKDFDSLTIDKVKELVNLGYESKFKKKKTKATDKTTKSSAKKTTTSTTPRTVTKETRKPRTSKE
jgi:DNA topoisomerase-1